MNYMQADTERVIATEGARVKVRARAVKGCAGTTLSKVFASQV